MAETRRQLFKTSILSAMGVMAASATTSAADLGGTRALVRAQYYTPPHGPYIYMDIILDWNGNACRAYKTLSPVTSGVSLDQYDSWIKRSNCAPAGGYYVVGSSASNAAYFLVDDAGVASPSNVVANVWNEIGRQ